MCVKQRFINKDILRPTAQPIIIPEKSEQDDILCTAIILIKLQMIYIAFILISTQLNNISIEQICTDLETSLNL